MSSKASKEEKDEIVRLCSRALEEDIGTGDVTTLATISPEIKATAKFLAKADGVVAGLEVAEIVFAMVDDDLEVKWSVADGDAVACGDYFGQVSGKAQSIVTAERVALNLLQRMSGIATASNKMVKAVAKDSKTKILDTRKTAPGLRVCDKLAHRIGGGTPHRVGLYDMVMIKDNHVSAAGGVLNAVNKVVEYLTVEGKMGIIPIEVETRTLEEVEQVLTVADKIDRLMLDNMTSLDKETGAVDVTRLEEALALINGRVATEASGNVTLETVPAISATNVDYISSGALTHSVTALDISLKIKQM